MLELDNESVRIKGILEVPYLRYLAGIPLTFSFERGRTYLVSRIDT